jgi:hypothetical protein
MIRTLNALKNHAKTLNMKYTEFTEGPLVYSAGIFFCDFSAQIQCFQ